MSNRTSIGNSFISHLLKIGIGTIIAMLIGLLTTPIITRIVDPEAYGQYSIFQMYTNVSIMILCLGLDQALVRFFYDKEEISYKGSLIRFCTGVSFLCATIICFAFYLIRFFVWDGFEFNKLLSFLLVINILIALLNRFSLLVLRVSYQSTLYSICNIIYRVFYATTVIVFVIIITNNDALCLCLGPVIGYLISTIVAIFFGRKYWAPKNKCDLENKIEIIRYGLPFILSMGITELFEAIDKIALDYFCDYSEVGIYASAFSIINVFAVIQTAFNALWGPRQVEEFVNNPQDTSFIKQGNQMITVIMFFLGISLILFRDVFALLLGEKFREAAHILPFLIFNPIMYTISETTCSGISKSKKSYLNIMVALGACITNFMGNLVLVPLIGSKGAAISTGISYFAFWALRTFFSNKYYYIDYRIKEFLIISFMTMLYALFNTFFDNLFLSVVGFLILCVLLFAFYRKTIKVGIKMLLNVFYTKKE